MSQIADTVQRSSADFIGQFRALTVDYVVCGFVSSAAA
jgi:hypothetical protein